MEMWVRGLNQQFAKLPTVKGPKVRILPFPPIKVNYDKKRIYT